VEEARAVIAVLEEELKRVTRENEALRQRVDKLCQKLFGRRSEKGSVVVPEQGVLPFAVASGEVEPEASDEDGEQEEERTVVRRRRHRGRRPLPQDLPREFVEIEPPQHELVCESCGAEKQRIGSDRTETMDYVPASFIIREYVRPRYACPCCKEGITQAQLPARPIEKGRPEPGLLAHVVTSKYADHLPLYRIEQIFARHGVEVSRRTLSEWNGAVADLLAPIVKIGIKAQLLDSPWIQCDDTTLEVQVADRTPQIRQGHMWVYGSLLGDQVYDFTWSRSRDGPMEMLEGYQGYLQADAAPGYDELFKQRPEIIEVGCWAHARRYFKEAVSSAPTQAARVVAMIGELYGVERSASGLKPEKRHEMRQQHSRPVLTRLFACLEELGLTVLPKSPLATAVGYALRNRKALERYIEDARLKIDNNGAERAIKPVVIGRKNWLFAGSEAAAHRTAVLLSLVQTCKNYGIDPFAYLRDVIERVSTHPMSRILELTPREWKRLRDEQAARSAA